MSNNTILATAPLATTGFHIKATGTTLGNSLIWDNGTNVGIGNTNTSYTLDVTGTGRFTGALTGAASTWSGNITIQKTAPNIVMKGGYTQDLGFFLNNEPSVYLVDDATATKGIRVNISTGAFTQLGGGASSFSGNVGIGTDSPVTKLDVVANSDATALTLRMRSTDDFAFLQFRNNAGTQVISEIYSNRTAANTGSLIFTTNNGGTATERMRITSGGGVCLGYTTDAGYQLRMSGYAYVGGNIVCAGDTNLGGATGFGKLDVGGQLNGVQQNVCRLGNINGVNNGLIIQVNSSNNYIYNFGTLGTGTVSASGGVLSTSSDMNLKNEDGFIENGLDKVMKLKPRYFYWKEETDLPSDVRQLGFYAQEVNEALGEEVANAPKDKHDKWGIYDRGIIAMLTKAIQEQNQTIQNLQEQINILAK